MTNKQNTLCEQLKAMGYEVTNPEDYVGPDSIISIVCKNGHRQTDTVYNFSKNNYECIECLKLNEEKSSAKSGYVLSLDIATNTTGWAIFSKSGHLITSGQIVIDKNLPLMKKVDKLLEQIDNIVKQYSIKEFAAVRIEEENLSIRDMLNKFLGAVEFKIHELYNKEISKYNLNLVIKNEAHSLDKDALIMRYSYIYGEEYPIQQCIAIACGKCFLTDDKEQKIEEALDSLKGGLNNE